MKRSFAAVLAYVLAAWAPTMAAVAVVAWKWQGRSGLASALAGGAIALAATAAAVRVLVRAGGHGLAALAQWFIVTGVARVIVVAALAVLASICLHLTVKPLLAGVAAGYLASLAGECVALARLAARPGQGRATEKD